MYKYLSVPILLFRETAYLFYMNLYTFNRIFNNIYIFKLKFNYL